MKRQEFKKNMIMHLKIKQKDIDEYMKNKIDVSNTFNTVQEEDFGIENKRECAMMHSFKNIEPTPANYNNEYYNIDSEKKEENSNLFSLDFTNKKINNSPEKKISKENIDYNLNVVNADINKFSDGKNNFLEENKSDHKIKITRLMREFADANKRKEWPTNTNILCWWCCHSFDGPPISIPKFHIDNIFYVYGCFCSFSCAAASIFNNININEVNKWKYFNLLHNLKNKIIKNNTEENIILSPSKQILKVFGGYMTIKEFRNIGKSTNNHYKIFDIISPPIVSIQSFVEESKLKNNNNKQFNTLEHAKGYDCESKSNVFNSKSSKWSKNNKYIPIDKDRMKRAEENIKLRRKVPLIDKKKTLLRYMNITINKKKK